MSWQPRGADLEAHRFAMWVITHARSRESYEEAEVGVGGRWERVGEAPREGVLSATDFLSDGTVFCFHKEPLSAAPEFILMR